jgi:uncharacterized protein (TIRG00374 family)
VSLRPAVVLGTNLVVGVGALVWVLYAWGRPALALLARAPDVASLLGFLACVAGGFACYALRWRVLIGDGAPGVPALAAMRAAGQSVSALVPSAKLGGEPVRALLATRAGVPAPRAIATVAIDRTLEMGAAAPFACSYATVLLVRGVPAVEGALVTVTLAALALGIGVAVTVRRLRRGAGIVTALARATGLDRLVAVERQMGLLEDAEAEAARLVAQPGRLARAFAVGVLANVVVLLEYRLLLASFALPSDGLAVVAAIFATGAAHSLPVPAAVGILEGAQMWLFGTLGHSPETGLAVGLAVRLRELAWIVPGLIYLLARTVARRLARQPRPTPAIS